MSLALSTTSGFRIKQQIKSVVNYFGYTIEKYHAIGYKPINVLDFVLLKVAAETSNFFFVQVGANDGINNDPIREYVKKFHWKGLLIEPLTDVFLRLLENYKEETQLMFENVAIAPNKGMISFFTVDEMLSQAHQSSSLDKNHLIKEFGSQVPIKETKVCCVPLETLVSKYAITKIDLLQIDAEGYDFEIIKMLNMSTIKPRIINFEHVHIPFEQRHECYRFLDGHGYRLAISTMDTLALLDT
jgi:FkbM family methyltransferase